MESIESFAARVFEHTGKHIADLPRREASAGDFIGQIICARGNEYVCGVGYPVREDDDCIQYWDDFEVVILK
jgi:hypothetical protein